MVLCKCHFKLAWIGLWSSSTGLGSNLWLLIKIIQWNLPNLTKEQNTHPKRGKGGITKVIQSPTKIEHSKTQMHDKSYKRL
jgi:hypothetical protein